MLTTLFQGAIRKSFPFWQSLGIHVTPAHFYEPVPDTRTLRDDLWAKPSALVGVRMNGPKQLELLERVVEPFKDEYDRFPLDRTSDPHEFYLDNGQFLGVDAEVLYALVRHFRPRRIIEIGSGYSTLLSASAIRRNGRDDSQYTCEFVAVDPQPPSFVIDTPGVSRIVRTAVQNVDVADLTDLGRNDILFVDSSHVLRIGSDVQFEYLEVLPRLPIGVLVHCHDIFLPTEYPKEWIKRRHRFWNEQYLVQAFLAFNDSFEILWAGSYLHHHHPDHLARAFRSYCRNGKWNQRAWQPGSLWLRRVA